METKQIAAAMESIVRKKEDLRKAFEAVQSYSAVLANFTLQWRELEEYVSSVEALVRSSQSPPASSAPSLEGPENPPRPEIRALCADMDGEGLRSFIVRHRKDEPVGREELVAALRSAPDAAALVLVAVDGCSPEGGENGEALAVRKTCVNLLKRVREVGFRIERSVRRKARKMAGELRRKVLENGNDFEGILFLHLLATYELVEEFEVEEIFDVVILCLRRNGTIQLCKILELEEYIPDFIQKLISKGMQLDAVKFIHAFNLIGEYPLVPLLKSYLKDIWKAAREIPDGSHPSSMSDAIIKQLGALRSLTRTIKDYGLESEFPCQKLEKRIIQLKQQKAAQKKRLATGASLDLKVEQQQQQLQKRPRTTELEVISDLVPGSVKNQQEEQIHHLPRPLSVTAASAVSSHAHPLPVQHELQKQIVRPLEQEKQIDKHPSPVTATTSPAFASNPVLPPIMKEQEQQRDMQSESVISPKAAAVASGLLPSPIQQEKEQPTKAQSQPLIATTAPAVATNWFPSSTGNQQLQQIGKYPYTSATAVAPAVASFLPSMFCQNRQQQQISNQSWPLIAPTNLPVDRYQQQSLMDKQLCNQQLHLHQLHNQQLCQQLNKQSRPLNGSMMPGSGGYPLPPLIQNPPQFGMTGQAWHMGLAGPYGIAPTGSGHNNAGSNRPPAPSGFGGLAAPPSSQHTHSEQISGASSHDKAAAYDPFDTK